MSIRVSALRSPRSLLAAALLGLALLALGPAPARAQCPSANDCMLPVGCAYTGTSSVPIPILPGHGLRGLEFHDPTTCTPPPTAPGPAIDSFFDIIIELDLTQDGGGTWKRCHGTGAGGLRQLYNSGGGGAPLVIDTEILQMELTGFGPCVGTMYRESPTLPSTGRTTITPQGGGGYSIDSFFDVFFELSLDGGATWAPTQGALHAAATPWDPTPARTSTWGALKTMYR